MKITVITPLFSLAGVPLAQLRFARALSKRGYSVDLMIGHIRDKSTFTPPENVNTYILNCPNVRTMLWPLVRYLRKEKPSIIFSAEDHLNILVLIAMLISGSKAKFSGSSRVTPFDTYSDVLFSKRWVLKQLSRLVMPRADALTCVSEDMVKQYQRVFKNPPHVCVYNIVVDAESRRRMCEPVNHPWLMHKTQPVLIAAGRLAPWKGFGDLIDAMVLLKNRRSFRLLILGDGPLRSALQEKIDDGGLSESVQLIGYVNNPLQYFSRSDVFILSSHVEGLPNVLVEAMLCGCTPVATDCPTGPREVLQDGKYGYLVPVQNPDALAAAIEQALDCPIPRAQLEEAIAPFEENRVIDRHFKILGIHT